MTAIVVQRGGAEDTLLGTLGSRTGASERGSHRRPVDGLLSLVALGVVVLAVAAVLGWNLLGGRLLVMKTPSMCPAVCVGSLVADRPLQGTVHVGELITFRPTKTSAETYTHEVSHIFPNGMIQTRGIANPEHDPWLITRSDIVGECVFSVWELGWLLKTLPLLAVGVLFWVLARHWVTRRSRRAWDRAWMTLLTVVPLWVLHPLLRGVVLSTGRDPGRANWVMGTVVNSGMLPASFRAASGRPSAHVPSTNLQHVTWPATPNGYLIVHEAVSLFWWGWAIVALIVVSPMAGYLLHVRRGDEDLQDGAKATT